MQVPVYGNNAYKYESYYKPEVLPRQKKVQKVQGKKRSKSVAPLRGLVFSVSAILLAFGLLLSNAQILEKNAKINELEERLANINAQVVAGEFKIERDMDLRRIEEEATTRLGMQRPTKAQTVYINMGNCDYAETETKAAGKNLFSAIADNVLEYFG